MSKPSRNGKISTCPCGCGQTFGILPPGTWLSYIDGWHRIRIVDHEGPEYSSREIGAGNDPAEAAEEAWRWWMERARRASEGLCWFCADGAGNAFEVDYPECPVCGRRVPNTTECSNNTNH
jgi:hypothetical protein